KKYFHIFHSSGSGDGTDFELGVPDEQQHNGEEDDDNEDDSEDETDDDNNDDDGDYNDDKDKNDDNDDEDNSDRTKSDRKDNADNAKEENEEEKGDAEELYRDVNVNLKKEDVEMTKADRVVHDTQKTEGGSLCKTLPTSWAGSSSAPALLWMSLRERLCPMQSSSVSSDFADKLLNFKDTSPSDNVIASLMDTTVHYEELSSHTYSLFTVPVTTILEITSAFPTTIPPPPLSFNPLPQQATPSPTPTTSKIMTSFPVLLDFSSVFKFNDRVTNLEKYLLEIKQFDRYAQAISSFLAIVDRYIDSK
nr:hypothetical protein [Tanacetum cinerariifolium]